MTAFPPQHPFGRVAAIEGNLIRLAEPSGERLVTLLLAFGQMAEHSATIADLMVELVNELDRLELDCKSSTAMDRARRTTGLFVADLDRTTRALQEFHCNGTPDDQAASSEKKEL